MCIQFVSDSLTPAVEALGVGPDSIMNLTVVPWGNAYFNTTHCGQPDYDKENGMFCWVNQCNVENPPAQCFTGRIMCQHGDNECLANRIEGCALKVMRLDDAVQFIECLEGAYMSTWRTPRGDELVTHAAEKCSQKNEQLSNCYMGDGGGAVDVANARRTVALGPGKLGTPWVLVNGKPIQDASELLRAVCTAYTGTKPAGCKRFWRD